MNAPQGPYLLQAALCEKVLTEADSVNSLIRIVDRVIHVEAGAAAPEQMPPVPYPLVLFLNLKPGRALGRHDLIVRLVRPDGQSSELTRLPVQFDGGEDRGTAFRIGVNGTYELEGLYWFDIYWEQADDDHLLNRMPLRLVYNRNLTQIG